MTTTNSPIPGKQVMSELLSVRDLSVDFRLSGSTMHAVRSVSFDIRPGETMALVRCMAALELRGRMVVMLSFFEERSAQEIANALETTAGNVRVVRHRAVAALRRCLDGGSVADGAGRVGAREEVSS